MSTSVIDYIFRDLAMRYLGRTDLVHVKPADIKPDAIDGEEEGEEPLLDIIEGKTTKVHDDGRVSVDTQKVFTKQSNSNLMQEAKKRQEAKIKGYEGEACSDCGAFTMLRNGSCLKCDSCGATTGCS
jgi:ribonucleoside-diphosphate reductase alpha chain